MDRALSLMTAAVAVTAMYFLTTERVIPALRGEPVAVAEGERLTESFELRRLGASRDEEREIRVPGARPYLLLVFSPACPACYTNRAAWREVIDAVSGSVRVLAVALERDGSTARAYVRENLPGAVAVQPLEPRRFGDALGVRVVPFTAIIDSDGAVRFMRQGSLDPAAVAAAKRALGALSGSSTR
jgi:hypothetical protein